MRNPLPYLLKGYQEALENISVPVYRESNVPKQATMPYVLVLEQTATGTGNMCGTRFTVSTQLDVCVDTNPTQADFIADEVMQAINETPADGFFTATPEFEDIRGLSEVTISGNIYRKIIRYSNYLIPK